MFLVLTSKFHPKSSFKFLKFIRVQVVNGIGIVVQNYNFNHNFNRTNID